MDHLHVQDVNHEKVPHRSSNLLTRSRLDYTMSISRSSARRTRRSRYRYSDLPDLSRTDATLATAQNQSQSLENHSLDRRQQSSPDETDFMNDSSHSGVQRHPGDLQFCSPEVALLPEFENRDQSFGECTDSEQCEEQDFLDGQRTAGGEPVPVLNQFRSIADWRVLWGLLATNGTNKMTKPQYQSVRSLLRVITSSTEQNAGHLPHFTTLHRSYRPILFQTLIPEIEIVRTDVDPRKAGVRPGSLSQSGQTQCQLPIILPSQYACSDMATGPVWDLMKSTSLHENPGQVVSNALSHCVDTWPLVASRKWFYGPRNILTTEKEDGEDLMSGFAESGDTVSVSILNGNEPLSETIARCFGSPRTHELYRTIQGIVTCSWTVHNAKRRTDTLYTNESPPNLSARDSALVRRLSYMGYVSPADSVSVVVPEAPMEDVGEQEEILPSGNASSKRRKMSAEQVQATKARRLAIKRRKIAMIAAWNDWKRPILKPGDTVFMLKPCLMDNTPIYCPESVPCATLRSDIDQRSAINERSAIDQRSRVCIVTRFWTECGERSRHVFFIPGCADVCQEDNQVVKDDRLCRSICSSFSPSDTERLILDVRQIRLISKHPGSRGYETCRPVSSIGTLATGEQYFVYRFVLFWDGFQTQTGKSVSGEGFYLVSLNLPSPARSSPNAIRVLTLTPPGASGEAVLRRILEDVEVGVTTGIVDYDAEGAQRRIFLDLVGIVGDTPAINYYLDVLGHTASACCHLCRFVRCSSHLLGSRYTGSLCHGMQSHSTRGFFQHAAVRDCGASTETLRLLGMKSIVPPTSMALLQYCTTLYKARQKIAKTSSGLPVVSHFFDPYRASFVAPDHVLTGHFRDCVALAFRLLPSQQYRDSCERFMLGFLEDAKLPMQSRLVDHQKKALFSMSMTEVYALSVVAEPAFRAGCAYSDRQNNRSEVSDKCIQAIRLVGSAANLISNIWFVPSPTLDGRPAVLHFDSRKGASRITQMQKLTDKHIEMIALICKMADSDVVLPQDPNCSQQRKTELSKIEKQTLLAVKTLDKPNIHRLRELSHTTLPMVGFAARIGELVFEKTHQVLKRAIILSHNREIEFHCVRSAAFSDWQGRLTLLAQDALNGSISALRGCFRLLFGRRALHAVQGAPKNTQLNAVSLAFGPDGFIVKELLSRRRSVLAPRALTFRTGVTWYMDSKKVPVVEDSSTPACEEAFMRGLKSAFVDVFARFDVYTSCRASYRYHRSCDATECKIGDILQVTCYHPEIPTCHRPFLLQITSLSSVPGWEKTVGPSLWCVTKLITLIPPSGCNILYAVVLPCVPNEPAAAVSPIPDIPRHEKYRVLEESVVSFAKLDDSVRVVGVLHNCADFNCAPKSHGVSISHGGNHLPLHGTSFVPLLRTHGYPPRRG